MNNVDNQALYQINNGGATILQGKITNDETFSLNADQNGEAQLVIDSVAALQGSGSVTLNGPNNQIKGTGRLINLQKIQGTGGTIKVAHLKNAGTISALLSNTSLTIQVGILWTDVTISTSPTSVIGTFATVNGTKINTNEHFKVSYTSSSVVLTVESEPAE